MENLVAEALREAIAYGLPIEFAIHGGSLIVRYKGRRGVYRILRVKDAMGGFTGLALAIPGLEAFSVKIVDSTDPNYKIIWENIPLAIGLDREFMSPAETDLWLRRFKLRGRLVKLDEPPGVLRELEGLGFTFYSSPDELDVAVGSDKAVALWVNLLTGRIDFAMEIQEEMKLHDWGAWRVEAVKKWIERVKQSRLL